MKRDRQISVASANIHGAACLAITKPAELVLPLVMQCIALASKKLEPCTLTPAANGFG